ncbi:MAG: hypothetical protein ACJ746_28945 [Bryobacteraceae bacterium]
MNPLSGGRNAIQEFRPNLSRRSFLGAAAAASVLSGQTDRPKRIAIITTVYRYLSHGQHMGDRFLVGYPHNGEWHKPNMQVVSLYVDQKPEGDLSGQRAQEFGFRVYPTIAESCVAAPRNCRLTPS